MRSWGGGCDVPVVSGDAARAAQAAASGVFAVELLQHGRNLGLGCALQTGLRHFLEHSAPGDWLAAMDCDNTHPPELLPLMLLVAVSLGSLGVFMATRIKSMEAFQGVMQLLMFPMVFLSGVFFPLQGLPEWMGIIVKINPATYGVYPLRLVMLGPEARDAFSIVLWGHTVTIWEDIIILALFGALMLTLAMWSFGHQD